MIRKLILTAALTTGLAAPAFAGQCPADMAAIDAALATASLSDADMAKVKRLRAQGEEEHNSGYHSASEATLAEAKAILGL